MEIVGIVLLAGYVLYNLYKVSIVVHDALIDALIFPENQRGEKTARAILFALLLGLAIDIWFITSVWVVRYYIHTRDEDPCPYGENDLV